MEFKDLSSKEKAKEKKEFTKVLGKRIRATRESQGLSQEKLAHRAGYYRTYIGHIENATYSPSVYTVWRLSKALNVSLEELLKEL